MKIGVGLNRFESAQAYSRFGDDCYKKMKSFGFSCVDYNFGNENHIIYTADEATVDAYLLHEKKLAHEAGIEISQTHGPWRWPPRDEQASVRADWLQKMKQAVRATAMLDCKYCVVHPIMPFGGNTSEQPDIMKAINFEFMSRLTEVAKEYGVIICYENMPFPLLPITTSKHVADFARKIGSDNFKVCLDTGHCLVCGEAPADAVRYIGKDLLGAMQVHDNDGKSDKHLIPGEGIADWDDFADALYEIGFDGVFSLETEIPTGNPADEQDRLERGLSLLGKKLARI